VSVNATPAPARPSPFRALIGILLIALGVCLLCWAAFQILRGPGTCGGDGAVACPDGFLFAVLGGFASFFLVIPVGIALSPKVAGLPSAVGILISGGLAATVYSSRFVADPITEGTVGTWIVVGILGTITVLLLLSLLASGHRAPDADAIRASLVGKVDVEPPPNAANGSKSSAKSSAPPKSPAAESSKKPSASAHANATARTADGTEVDLGMDTIRQLLLHGLANGELATTVEVGRIGPDHKPDVQRLLDLHKRGVIDDDALRDALAALRAS
jgi:hypothetical protein